jgi:hypothetical protein
MAKSGAASTPAPTPTSSETNAHQSKASEDGSANVFKDAADKYGHTLVQLSSALQEAQREALQTYLDALAGGFKPGRFDSVTAAYQDLIKATNGPDPAKIAGAQAAYLDTLKDIHFGVESTTKTAAEDYVATLQSVWKSAQEETGAAYESFIKDIKPALADLQNLVADPAGLILIGHSLCVAGFLGAQAAASRSRIIE